MKKLVGSCSWGGLLVGLALVGCQVDVGDSGEPPAAENVATVAGAVTSYTTCDHPACQICRSKGYPTATDNSMLVFQVWYDVGEVYRLDGMDEGHDHAYNVLTGKYLGAPTICTDGRGTCSGKDGGCPFGSLYTKVCEGAKGTPTCKAGESCTGRWGGSRSGVWLPRDTWPLGYDYNPLTVSVDGIVTPTDCDCTKATVGKRAGWTAKYTTNGTLLSETFVPVGGQLNVVTTSRKQNHGWQGATDCRNASNTQLALILDGAVSPPPPSPPTCGALGGDYCSTTTTCPTGYTNLGASSDCARCCKYVPPPTCGALGGDYCSSTTTCPTNYTNLGQSSDCTRCCKYAPPPPPPTCGALGGDYCSSTTTCPTNYTNLGQSSDCTRCCKAPALPSCGALGGDYCSGSTSCPTNYSSLGQSSDCTRCCKYAPPPPPPPAPSCGAMGGDYCSQSTSCPAGYDSLGSSSDCVRCCQQGPSCGAAGGNVCNQNGSCPAGATDLGRTYDCNHCCAQ